MATLPPVILGVIILVAYTLALILRTMLLRRIVLTAPFSSQSRRQFSLDFFASLFAGILGAGFNMTYLGFPLESGLSLIAGCLVAGFFLALDMALARERAVISQVMVRNRHLPPPKRLYSMTRRFALVAFTTALCVSLVVVMVISRDVVWLSMVGENPAAQVQAQMSVTYEVLFIVAVLLALVINLIVSYSRNLKLLFDNETTVLERVSQGDFSRLVPVATNDEFGFIAGHTNHMIDGLKHRIQLLSALKLAEEVQQNLLPGRPPQHSGLDIAGSSKYCDETGGDYYDFLELPEGRLGIVVADATDHGVGSALQMTTARAFLLFGARDYQGPARLIDDVNHYLTRDSYETSRFMSMFFLEIATSPKNLRWVRAGHDPALLYDPEAKSFQQLGGEGIVLGVTQDYRYREHRRDGWRPGMVLVLGTDGIHETHDSSGQMFGQQRLQHIIREHAHLSAQNIQDAVIDALERFRGDEPQEDDITLVVVKFLQ
jgi:sigma-B regulation protein RsbU (phosphoserine phosphatase)